MKRSPPAQTSTDARPFVFVNMAMTADGKIATAGREVHTFGSARDLRHLYELRATADAILSGARTIEHTRATLGNGGESFRKLRLRRRLSEYPLRVVVTGSGSISADAEIWKHRFSPIIALTRENISAARLRRLRNLADQVWQGGGEGVDFEPALARLRNEFGVQRLLVEGGGEVNAALFKAGLVDEVHLTLCPWIVGGRDAPTIADGVGARLADAAQFRFVQRRQRGDEIYLVARRIDGEPAR